jgi:hypothetical protein
MIGNCFEVQPPRTQEFPQTIACQYGFKSPKGPTGKSEPLSDPLFLAKEYRIRKRYVNLDWLGISNGTITATLQKFRYLTTEDLVIE